MGFCFSFEIAEHGGEEHRVWLDEDGRRYFKATFPGKFAFTIILRPEGTPDLTEGTPLDYLERLLLQNSIFGDSIALEGVAEEEGGF